MREIYIPSSLPGFYKDELKPALEMVDQVIDRSIESGLAYPKARSAIPSYTNPQFLNSIIFHPVMEVVNPKVGLSYYYYMKSYFEGEDDLFAFILGAIPVIRGQRADSGPVNSFSKERITFARRSKDVWVGQYEERGLYTDLIASSHDYLVARAEYILFKLLKNSQLNSSNSALLKETSIETRRKYEEAE